MKKGQRTYRGHPTLRVKVFPLFEEHGRNITFREIAQRFNCSESAISRLWQMWEGQKARRGKAQCARCGFYEWEHNPVWDNLCLWCRADMAGVVLEPLVQAWGWAAVIAAFREGGTLSSQDWQPSEGLPVLF